MPNTIDVLGDDVAMKMVIERTITEFIDDEMSLIGVYAFQECTSLAMVSFPECSLISENAFGNCTHLTSVSFPACTTVGQRAFYQCSALTSISFPECTTIANEAFRYCSSLTVASFPLCERIPYNGFNSCYQLGTISLPKCTAIDAVAFSGCTRLLSLYLMGSAVCTLAASNAFSITPIGGYVYDVSGQYGSIYVPASLLTQYQSATNWTFFSNRFVGI